MAEFSNEADTVKVLPINLDEPVKVLYCPNCTMPAEYCQYGPDYEKCLPWHVKNCPELVSEENLSKMMGEISLDNDDNDDNDESEANVS